MINTPSSSPIKQILENIRFPENLNTHPWVDFQLVTETRSTFPDLDQKDPGTLLVKAVSNQFLKLMPTSPPRRGKRLDTRWGKFGILAAQYFAPYCFGLPYPGSLQDAWGRIDDAILLFVYGKPKDSLSEQEVQRYKLVGNEPEVAARSTISDWHINGSQQLTDLILDYEQHLKSNLPLPNPEVVSPDVPKENLSVPLAPGPRRGRRWVGWLITLVLLALLSVTAAKAWKIYRQVTELQADVSQLRGITAFASGMDVEKIKLAGPVLDKFRQDLGLLNQELAVPLRTAGLWLAWLPGYGPDLAAAADLLDLADKSVGAAQKTYTAVNPMLQVYQTSHVTVKDLTKNLLKISPQLNDAHADLLQAQQIRSRLDVSKLSPRSQTLVMEVDRVLSLLDDGLSIALTAPKILGASSEGPKTYLLLIQNEDELRPTGGYIGVVGSFVIKDGLPMDINFQDTSSIDDWTKPYPEAPWQLEEYMNIPALVLRDANWYPSYPVAVSWIEFLYAYTSNHSVDGVIAIDQQSLVFLLQAIGPVTVKGSAKPVTAENIIQFMREAKAPPVTEKDPGKWLLEHRKDFVAPLADSIMAKLLSSEGSVWEKITRSLLRALNERHILLQFDDSLATDLLTKYGWDGALKPGKGDFLMSVDSNVGYNKASAFTESRLEYSVDLTDLQNPVGSLVTFHTNNASKAASCLELDSGSPSKNYIAYAMDRCSWIYSRIYVPKGTRLAESTPHFIPATGTVFGRNVPAHVDVLDMEYEEIDNASGFGTLLGVSGGQTLSTSYKFLLPVSVVAISETDTGQKTYTLKIQKQPGTRAPAVTIRIHLPANAQIVSTPPGATVQGSNILLETTLLTDINLAVVFRVP